MTKYIIFLLLILPAFTTSKAQLAFLYSSAGSEYRKANTVDIDTNYIEAALFANTININPNGTTNLTSFGAIDVVFAKYNKNGNLMWGKRIGGVNTTDAPHGIVTDAQRNVYITGYCGNTTLGNQSVNFNPNGGNSQNTFGHFDAFLAKYDLNGNYQWAMILGNTNGATEERAWDIAVDGQNNVYVCGAMHGSVNFNPLGSPNIKSVSNSNAGIFLAKYNPNGINEWAFVISANDTSVFYEAYTAVDIDAGGNIYFGGNFRGSNVNFNPIGSTTLSSAGATDMFFSKYTPAGNLIWAKRIGGTLQDILSPGALRLDNNNMPFLTGRISGTVNFNTSGGTNNVSGASLFLASYDTSGVMRNAFGMQSNPGDGGHRIDFDNHNNVYVAGWMNGTVNFNPNGIYNLTAISPTADVFLAKYTNAGNFIWALNFGAVNSTDQNICAGLTVDLMNNIIITGQLYGTNANINPKGTQFLLSSVGQNDCFIIKYDSLGTLWSPTSVKQISNELPENFNLEQNYPNPFNPETKIKFNIIKTGNVNLTVYNLSGKEITTLVNRNLQPGTYETTFNANNLPSGIYCYKLESSGTAETKRMVLIK